jgi:cysteine desulfurase / selenocysteine lyase
MELTVSLNSSDHVRDDGPERPLPYLYLDNAATSYPKPACVYQAVQHAMWEVGATPGRGAHRKAREALALMSDARAKVARLFGISSSDQVIFTKNATESINVVLKGWLRPGDRVLITGLEHNAVVRPLRRLSEDGVRVEVLRCGSEGQTDLQDLQEKLDPAPRLVVFNHACNVNGALQPVAEAAALCARAGVPMLLDAAQTAGLQPIHAESWRLGMLACSGHKALLGPPGVGILYVRPDLGVQPLIEGGTGSHSEDPIQPEFCPDRYESGTPNLPGIAGLAVGIGYLRNTGMEKILQHELALARMLEQELTKIPGVLVQKPEVRGTGAVSFTVESLNPADVAHLLDEGFGIAVRSGLHCAPLAHQMLRTFPEGTVRISPGFASTEQDMAYVIESLQRLLHRQRKD